MKLVSTASDHDLAIGLLGRVSVVETVLVAVVAILLAVLVGLAAMVLALRRRERGPSATPTSSATTTRAARVAPRPAGPRVSASAGGGVSLAGPTGASVGPTRSARPPRPQSGMVCPTCSSEFHGLTYCIHDARRLVPAEEMLAVPRSAGVFCLVCRRAFEPGLRRCPHDGGPVISAASYWASRPRRKHEGPTGVIGRICPTCQERYDLSSSFCGHDGAELLVIN